MPSATTSHRGSSRLSTASSQSLPSNAATPGDPLAPSASLPLQSSSTSSSAAAATVTPSSSSRPSLLSRLSLPLMRNRNRNVADFHIRPEEPYRQYAAGEHVRGSVVLVIVKPVRMTHLVVSLNGFVRVFKDPVSAVRLQNASATLPQGGSSRPQYLGNGFATLFQDEQVLSGEGRLEPGKYEFGFDLVFPDKGLPSSIDFERGTIAYTVTATLTRPTSIAPTSSCDRKVMLVDKVDIGLVQPPRPRTIFLEPISKRTRRRKSMATTERTSNIPADLVDGVIEADSAEQSTVIDDAAREAHPEQQRSPVQYDMRSESGGSARSVSTAISRTEFAPLSQVGTTFTSPAKQQVVDNKTITTTIALLKGGCLPGDTVSVRVMVQHVKPIKSMTGVVVTLFRQCKIDTAPPLSIYGGLISREEAKSLSKDETWPRSRTGLAGLSLSSSGSTNLFRKDLDQNTAPLITDPETLQATVTVSLKLPDDAFPTINGVPGDMLSFRYQVEVIVDLGGRMSNLVHQTGNSSSRYGAYSSSTPEAGGMYGPRRGVMIADTAMLRREKGVVSVNMETMVGTVDSSRERKSRTSPSRTIQTAESDDEDVTESEAATPREVHPRSASGANGTSSSSHAPPPPVNDNTYDYTLPPQEPPSLPLHGIASSLSRPSQNPLGEATPSYVPPPEIPDQNNLSEKERVRQAETRLLPSQPPTEPAGPSDAAAAAAQDDLYDAESVPVPDAPSAPGPSHTPATNTEIPDNEAGPSAPTEDDLLSTTPGEDKQERERQRLMGEASAPPEVPSDAVTINGGPSGHAASPNSENEPSAPVLDEDDDGRHDDDDDVDDPYASYGVGAGPSNQRQHGHAEPLPAYER